MIGGKQAENKNFLYTGLATVNVKFFNPTKEQLKEIYGENVKEPNYAGQTKAGNPQLMLKIYYEAKYKDITFYPVETIFISDEEVTSKGGNSHWINNQGQTRWAVDVNNISEEGKKWFNLDAVPRKSKGGEVELYNLIVAWANLDTRAPETTVTLETPWEEVVAGNVDELNSLITALNRPVKVMLGVKDGQYQDVYNRDHLSASSTYTKGIAKQLQDSEYGWKSDFQGSFTVQPYNPLDKTAPVEVVSKEAVKNMI